ncbi:hypothetical protein GCM10027091_43860 [Streptomyces daliensis]
MNGARDVYIVDAVRTPAGKYGGALLPELDPALVNPRGGALAIGHPLAASGARLTGAVAHQLAAKGTGVGVASPCTGVGQGLALVLER